MGFFELELILLHDLVSYNHHTWALLLSKEVLSISSCRISLSGYSGREIKSIASDRSRNWSITIISGKLQSFKGIPRIPIYWIILMHVFRTLESISRQPSISKVIIWEMTFWSDIKLDNWANKHKKSARYV